jgi:hypothetical protein
MPSQRRRGRRRLPFGGHVPDEVGIERALEAGQRTIDHLDGILSLLVPAGVDTGDPGFFGYGLAPHADERRIPRLSSDFARPECGWSPPRA